MSSKEKLLFNGKVAIVTGSGNGLGKAYAKALAERGAKVVINDLGGGVKGDGKGSTRAADLVVEEIRAAGGEAVANYDSVEFGDKIVKTAIDTWGRVDIVVNNAGILRDTSFVKMKDQDWDLVQKVHLGGTYSVCKAAWPHMREKRYGRIINVSSASGLYGNFGQANYSSAKLAIVGLSSTLAKEGASRNILVNVICPVAGSRMTETIMPAELVEALKPEYVAPLVVVLAHESCEKSGEIYEVGAGWTAAVRWQRTKGLLLPLADATSPEAYRDGWERVMDWDNVEYPEGPDIGLVAGHAMKQAEAKKEERMPSSDAVDPNVALGAVLTPSERTITEKDVMLYALGVGAAAEHPTDSSQLRYTYENHPDFSMLPTMGVTFADIMVMFPLPGLTFNPMMLLHGEHSLEVLSHPLPTSGTLRSESHVAELWDKGKAALVVIESITSTSDGRAVFKNRMSAFIRGIGGWGGERGPKPPSYAPPARAADAVVRETTAKNQALLYRLPSGDANPLHADPQMSAMGGFDTPILHGLCSFGYAGRAVLASFAGNDSTRFKSIAVRFAGHVFPGETLETRMWKISETQIVFETRVVERDTVAISNAMVELFPHAKL